MSIERGQAVCARGKRNTDLTVLGSTLRAFGPALAPSAQSATRTAFGGAIKAIVCCLIPSREMWELTTVDKNVCQWTAAALAAHADANISF